MKTIDDSIGTVQLLRPLTAMSLFVIKRGGSGPKPATPLTSRHINDLLSFNQFATPLSRYRANFDVASQSHVSISTYIGPRYMNSVLASLQAIGTWHDT